MFFDEKFGSRPAYSLKGPTPEGNWTGDEKLEIGRGGG